MKLYLLFQTISLVIPSYSRFILCCEKATLVDHDPATVVDGEYIVVFKQDAEDHEILHHKQHVESVAKYIGINHEVRHEFNIGTSNRFRGYSAKMDDRMVDVVLKGKQVAYIERNNNGRIFNKKCSGIQRAAPWGLSRTATKQWPPHGVNDLFDLNFEYDYSRKDAGRKVDVYVIDTGIDTNHQDFHGRAKFGVDFVNSPAIKGDPVGHGTHIAGTIMSTTFGIAKKATAISVRVCNIKGSCAVDAVIKGIEWAVNQHKSGRSKRSVANLSLGSKVSIALNEAANAAINEGLHIVCSAGNSDKDACTMSPASSDSIAVAASDINDRRASFSNYGPCVDLIAPGVSIISTLPNNKVGILSGTSMSSPHVVGVIAKLLTKYLPSDISQAGLLAELKRRAQKGKIRGFPAFPPTTNDLVFMECNTG